MSASEVFVGHSTGSAVDASVQRERLEALSATLEYAYPYPSIPDREGGRCRTHEAEDGLGIGRCVYFYAGYLRPRFGPIGLIVGSTVERVGHWSASAFDSGGLFHGAGAFGIEVDLAKRVALFNVWNFPGNVWRAKFEADVAQGFRMGVEDYVEGRRPVRLPAERQRFADNVGSDDEILGESRAWRWEVRGQTEVTLRSHIKAVILTDQGRVLLQRVSSFSLEATVLAHNPGAQVIRAADRWEIEDLARQFWRDSIL
jgi:hypothetical protein